MMAAVQRTFVALTSCLVLGIASFATKAQEARDVERLLQLMKFEVQLEGGRKVCMSRPEQIDMVALYKEGPGLFLGVDPSSDMWPDVVMAYTSYLKEMCVPSSIDKYSKLARSLYASKLTPTELKAATSFFESEAGEKLVSASVEVTDVMNRRMLLEADERAESSWNSYMEKVRKIKELENPKTVPGSLPDRP